VMFLSIKTLLYTALTVFLFYGLFTVGFPFLLAFLIAFLVDPLILLLVKRSNIKRIYASFFVCTSFTLILCGLTYLLITKVSHEAVALSKTLLQFTKDTYANMDWLNAEYLRLFQNIPPEYNDTLQQVSKAGLDAIQNLLAQSATLFFNLAKTIPNFFLQAIIFFLAFYLISINLPEIKKGFLQFFDPSVHSKVKLVLIKLHNTIFGFLRAQFIISTLIFTAVLIGFLIMGINYSSALALFITVVDILPVLGTGSIMVPMAVYYLIIGNTFLFWGLLIHYAFITVFRRAIEPKILAENIGISALATLASMYIGYCLTGFIGIFLGPFLVIFYQALVKVGILNIKIKF
jgi:sporulation integral membrane protein YtvI